MVKIFDDMFISFDTTKVTDTDTPTHTHTRTLHDGIGRAYAQHRAALSKLCTFGHMMPSLLHVCNRLAHHSCGQLTT